MFLAGPVGDAIVETVRRHGGVLDHDDLGGGAAEWHECPAIRLDTRTVWATPAPTHGPTLLAAVAPAVPGDAPATQYQRVLAAIARRRDGLADPSGTSIVSAADRDGNAVVVVHSNSYPRYGSGTRRSRLRPGPRQPGRPRLHPGPGHPNFPAAGRRPATTLHAWMTAVDGGSLAFLGGTPGGDNQVSWNAQLLQGIVDGETSPGACS